MIRFLFVILYIKIGNLVEGKVLEAKRAPDEN